MTYFLDDAPIPFKPRGNDLAPSTWTEGLAASTSQMMRDTNASWQREREVRNERFTTAEPIARRVGIEALNERYERDGPGFDHLRPAPKTVDEFFSMLPMDEASEIALTLGRELAEADPKAWADLDLSDDGIEERVTKRRIAEDAEEAAILDMMPNGRASAEFLGGMAGMLADVRQIPFLVAGGGGGSILKIMGREAVLNCEGSVTPSAAMFRTAKELGKDEPDVVRALSMAAAGGAIIGGAVGALGRAVSYYQGRSQTPRIPGMSRAMSKAVVSAAEDAIARGEDPVKAIAEAMGALPVERPPLIEPPQVAQPTAEARVAQREADIADAESAFDTDFPEMKPKYPLAEMIKRMGGIAAKRLNRATGDMEPSFAAQELANMGVTQRTHPFMFRKNGHTDFDNIVASEHPGLRETVRFDPETGYFDRDDLIGALGRELSTGNKHPLSGEIEARRREIDELHSSDYRSAEEDALDGNRAEDGFFVDHKTYGFRDDDYLDMSRRFDEWAERRGFTALLSADERGEILTHLDTRGGDAEYLVESVLNRKRKFVDGPEAGKADETEALGREGADEGRPVPRQEAGGRGGPDGSATAYRAEETAAGQQSIIPGVEPITQRQRLEAAQNTPKRGMDRPMDTGLFDMGARQQMDMFSDPMSREARAVQGNIAADIRDQIEADGDFLVDIGDGKGERPASSVLDDLDAGDKASARMDLCGKFSTDIPF